MFLFLSLLSSRVCLAVRDWQDEVSNWLCVQVTIIQLQALQCHRWLNECKSEPYEEKKKRKRLSSQKKKQLLYYTPNLLITAAWFGHDVSRHLTSRTHFLPLPALFFWLGFRKLFFILASFFLCHFYFLVVLMDFCAKLHGGSQPRKSESHVFTFVF